MTLDELLRKIKMPHEACRHINEIGSLIAATDGINDRLDEQKKRFYTDEDINDALCHIASSLGCTKDELALAFCIRCIPDMLQILEDQGLDESDRIANLIDLTIWTKVCRRDYGVWGMHEFDWLSRSLRGRLWRLGRLQFEEERFICDIYTRAGITLCRGDRVINTHIPDDGPMPDGERLASYKRAFEFFGFGNFVCDSYLLYPPQRAFLPPNSNILHFMDEFDIISVTEDDAHRDMWRIFGGIRNWRDTASLPRDTSLRRGYADHIARTGLTGMGYGVMLFDGEKIIK